MLVPSSSARKHFEIERTFESVFPFLTTQRCKFETAHSCACMFELSISSWLEGMVSVSASRATRDFTMWPLSIDFRVQHGDNFVLDPPTTVMILVYAHYSFQKTIESFLEATGNFLMID